jgi:hypothetical protein
MARKTSGKGDRRPLIYPPYYLQADSKEQGHADGFNAEASTHHLHIVYLYITTATTVKLPRFPHIHVPSPIPLYPHNAIRSKLNPLPNTAPYHTIAPNPTKFVTLLIECNTVNSQFSLSISPLCGPLSYAIFPSLVS